MTAASAPPAQQPMIRSFSVTEFRAATAEGAITAVISTGDVARDGAMIEATGWRLENYRRNPVVLYAHDDSSNASAAGLAVGMPIARTTDVHVEGGALVATAQFDMQDEFATKVFRKIRKGFINAVSVRWLPLAFERRKITADGAERNVLVFTRQEFLEWSVVPIPADPNALVARRGMTTKPEPFAAYVARLLGQQDRHDGPQAAQAAPGGASLAEQLVEAAKRSVAAQDEVAALASRMRD